MTPQPHDAVCEHAIALFGGSLLVYRADLISIK